MMPRYFILLFLLGAPCIEADDFSFTPVGKLNPANSGHGRVDVNLYAPMMVFPIRRAPAYANSQVFGSGGSHGSVGSQCDTRNFQYPWHDNFCETRSGRTNPACPTGQGHEGQDIRPADCSPDTAEAIAAETGRISKIGPFWVGLVGDSGIYYSYLHLNPHRLAVKLGERVSSGDTIGYVSDYMNGPHGTTTHLHFEIHASIIDAKTGRATLQPVSPYFSLVEAYKRLLNAQR